MHLFTCFYLHTMLRCFVCGIYGPGTGSEVGPVGELVPGGNPTGEGAKMG